MDKGPDGARIWTAGLVVIGDEILSGRTQDKNVAQLASWLNVQGIRLEEVRVVPDVTARIVEAVNALRGERDYCFTTGGIGPTHDDITVDAVAEHFVAERDGAAVSRHRPSIRVWPRQLEGARVVARLDVVDIFGELVERVAAGRRAAHPQLEWG